MKNILDEIFDGNIYERNMRLKIWWKYCDALFNGWLYEKYCCNIWNEYFDGVFNDIMNGDLYGEYVKWYLNLKIIVMVC